MNTNGWVFWQIADSQGKASNLIALHKIFGNEG